MKPGAYATARGRRAHGVTQFFSAEIAEPDPTLLAIMDTIGTQIGQFVERRLAHERLRAWCAEHELESPRSSG